MNYLEEVITDVLEQFSSEEEHLVFVTTNKRSIVFLRNYFAQQVRGTVFAPTFVSISELFERISGFEEMEPLPLLFEFYDSYRTVKEQSGEEPNTFEEFLSWGSTTLQDFNEIDENLVLPERIFPYMQLLKEAEHWSGADELTAMQQEYLQFWKELGSYYHAFEEKLTTRRQAYKGFIARKANEAIDPFLRENKDKIFIFVGFNALTKAERKLITNILDTLRGEIYWDIDTYFLKDKEHDAGYFIRKYKGWDAYLMGRRSFKWESDNYKNNKEIHITGVPKSINQAHCIAEILPELLPKETTTIASLERTAIVLGDEQLLLPVLEAVMPLLSLSVSVVEKEPEMKDASKEYIDTKDKKLAEVLALLKGKTFTALEKTVLVVPNARLRSELMRTVQPLSLVNITMGYPLEQLPIRDVFASYFRLHLTGRFYYKDVLGLITQPFVYNLLGGEVVRAITGYINAHNYSYVTRHQLLEATEGLVQESVVLLFPEKDGDFISTLINNAMALAEAIREQVAAEALPHKITLESLYRFYELFEQLKALQHTYRMIDTVKTLYHFFLEVLQKDQLQFVGEPLEGLQIMGLFESRSLDFDNVIITSLNEGILPKGKSGNSFIPYDVRMELDLFTAKGRDAVYSYTFYRLLQRAHKVHLLYDTETDSLKSKERSRFILQLLTERGRISEAHKADWVQVKVPEVYPVGAQKLEVVKTAAVMERLKEMAEKGLSPSAITNYVRNPMIFYQQNLLEVYEEDSVEETVEARTFGKIMHSTLESLYKPYLSQQGSGQPRYLTEGDIHEMRKRLKAERLIEHFFEEEYHNADFKTGKNLLILNVIDKYLHRFLDMECEQVKRERIEVLYLEKGLKVLLGTQADGFPFEVNLRGIVDRVDRRDGVLHIIDYKTGVVESSDVGITDADKWELLLKDVKYSKAFQLLTYAYMYRKTFAVQEDLTVGNISFKRLNQGLLRFYTKKDKSAEDYKQAPNNYIVDSAILAQYWEQTRALLLEIFNDQVPFVEM